MADVGDEAVRATCNDASMCKWYAVQRGYWTDPYICLLVQQRAERKTPEINRGYYARVRGMWELLTAFLHKAGTECQVIGLGAGFDTTFWRLKDQNLLPRKYFEIDFPTITARKLSIIRSKQQLANPLLETHSSGNLNLDRSDLDTDRYALVGADLREPAVVEEKLRRCGLNPKLPTVLLAECVLVYMAPSQSCQLLRWAADTFQTALFLSYEQVNLGDRFGQVMIENLRQRHCFLAGAMVCHSFKTQVKRYLDSNWPQANALDMRDVYRRLPKDDVKRIEALEFLDEGELLQQLLQHYCISWAWKDQAGIGLDSVNFDGGRPPDLL
uniref:leucine carboxyl methyltransferase 1 isoform X2 n=1 Tax=Myxine glutinosa TaxID=7769 RepID=UPI00358F4CDA